MYVTAQAPRVTLRLGGTSAAILTTLQKKKKGGGEKGNHRISPPTHGYPGTRFTDQGGLKVICLPLLPSSGSQYARNSVYDYGGDDLEKLMKRALEKGT